MNIKKLISLMLMSALVLAPQSRVVTSFAPIDSFAEEENEKVNRVGLFRDGDTLYISGSGVFPNSNDEIWNEYRDVRKIIVRKGVTMIPGRTFEYFNSLNEVELPDGIEYIGDCNLRKNIRKINFPESLKYVGTQRYPSEIYHPDYAQNDGNGNYIADNGVLMYVDTEGGDIVIPDNVRLVARGAIPQMYQNDDGVFYPEYSSYTFPDNCVVCESIVGTPKKVVFGDNCYITIMGSADSIVLGDNCIIDPASYFTVNDTATFGNNCTINGNISIGKAVSAGDNCAFEGEGITLKGVESFVTGNGCKLGKLQFYKTLKEFSVGDSDISKITLGASELEKFDIVRKSRLTYRYSNKAQCSVKTKTIKGTTENTFYNTYGSNSGYSNYSISPITNLMDSNGNLVALYKSDYKTIMAVPYDDNKSTFTLTYDDFMFGAADIGPDDCLYVLWGKDVDDSAAETEIENLVLVKYDLEGNVLGSVGCPLKKSYAMSPFDAGNAEIIATKEKVICVYDTLWLEKLSNDGFHHQGAGLFNVNPDTMELLTVTKNFCGHSFGMSAAKSDDRYAVIQNCDANPRGIHLKGYNYIKDENGEISITKNYDWDVFSAPGQYGTNEHHLDGNTTYIQLGGVAMSEYSLAVAGKAEKVFTSEVHYQSDAVTNKYDVFVCMNDIQFSTKLFPEYAGTERVDVSNGKVINNKVVWLTEANDSNTFGQVKIVTLNDGSYCVLWEKYVNREFDSVRYVIMDQYGNILRKESAIPGTRLSNSCVQPLVKGDELIWAVADGLQNSIIWYSVDMNADYVDDGKVHLGDVNSDGSVNAADASEILKEYSSLSTGNELSFTDNQKEAANVNFDDKIDSSDASLILMYYSYLSTGGTQNADEFFVKTD